MSTYTDEEKKEIVRLYRGGGFTMLKLATKFGGTMADIFAVITASNPK